MKTKTYLIVSIALLTGMSVWAQKPVTVSIYDDCSKNGKTEDIRSVGEENGRTWVDLGLPSGLKWASCNVGAYAPEGYGYYYAWGETERRKDLSWLSYKYANSNSTELTKYCNDASYGYKGFTDYKTTLKPEDDAAHVNWDGNWRMPTDAEWKELIENCTWTWTWQNDIRGYRVTSKTNSNSIFLPAAGELYINERYDTVGRRGNYWSSSLSTDEPDHARCLVFSSDYAVSRDKSRNNGFSVRPVCP